MQGDSDTATDNVRATVIKIDANVIGADSGDYGYYFFLGGYFKDYSDLVSGEFGGQDLTTYSGGTFITIPNTLADGSGQRTQGFPQQTPLDFYTGTQNGCPRWWYATTLGDLGDLLEGPTSSALWEPCFGDFGTTGQFSLSSYF